MIGNNLANSPDLSWAEKLYVRLLGAPVSGLRIRLRRVLPNLPGGAKKVLDAGCGRGVFCYEIAKKLPEARVVGVDIDAAQLDKNRIIAARSGLKNLLFHEADISALDFNEEFDLLVSVDNLEHLEDDMAGLASLYRAARKGARLALHVPGLERRWPLFAFRQNFDVPGHCRPGYTRAQIVAKTERAGFRVDESFYTFGWWETVTNNLSYLVTGAEEKNKMLYAVLFPVMNALAWLGRNSRPNKGAGVFVLATKI